MKSKLILIPIPWSNWAMKKNQTFHDKSSPPALCDEDAGSVEHSTLVWFSRDELHKLSSGTSARYGPTRKWGSEKVRKPNPITTMPQPTHFGFDAPMRPPKYETGIRQKKLAMS